MDKIRLQLFLARSGIASRRKSAELIEEGRVSVNGTIVTEKSFQVSDEDDVRFDGRPCKAAKKKVYIALNKPVNYLSANSDPRGRDLAINLVQPNFTVRLFHVGRLDFKSSGLIFFTNDGEFARKVAHPSAEVEKEYLVSAKIPVPEELLLQFKKGIYIKGESFRIKRFYRKSPVEVGLILSEGKNREIRKVFEHFRLPVKRLHRIRIGNASIKGLHPGQYRLLSKKELDFFRKLKA